MQLQCTNTAGTQAHVLLQTAKVRAHATNGIWFPVRVLLDGGSQKSYITDELKNKLGLIPIRVEALNLNTFGSDSYKRKTCDLVKLKLQGKEGEIIEIQAASFPKICSPITARVEVAQLTRLHDLELADYDSSDNSGWVDVLIGSDHNWEVVSGDVVRETSGLVAMKSIFGWLLSGPVKGRGGAHTLVTTNLAIQEADNMDMNITEDELNNQLKQFWETETIGIEEIHDSYKDNASFLQPIKFNKEQGKYEIHLPWKSSWRPMSTSYNTCMVRLHHLRSQLRKSQDLAQEYSDIIRKQIKDGIIEKVPPSEENSEEVFYLPHHGVLHTDKETTKLRIVFDGSAKDQNQCSLND